jgi:hypothetical protein
MKHITLALVAVAFVSLTTVHAADLPTLGAQHQCCSEKDKPTTPAPAPDKKPEDSKKS